MGINNFGKTIDYVNFLLHLHTNPISSLYKFWHMNITFNELRRIKHSLPTGGVKMIADQLSVDEQTVRNYFGAKKYKNGDIGPWHIQPGPDGGIVNLRDTEILEAAKSLIKEYESRSQPIDN